mgnify:CR=1 FL=1
MSSAIKSSAIKPIPRASEVMFEYLQYAKDRRCTGWFNMSTLPTQKGLYRCLVKRWGDNTFLFRMLYWNGEAFDFPYLYLIHRWQGLTRKAFLAGQGRAAENGVIEFT